MNMKKICIIVLCLCLLAVPASPAFAAEPALDSFLDRYGSLLGDGMDSLTDWLEKQTADLAPELRETLRDVDTDSLFSDLRDLLGDTAGLDDAALRAKIEAVAVDHGVHLVESQVQQLMDLCRALEKLDPATLRERTDALGRQLNSRGGLRGIWDSVVQAVSSAADWIAQQISGLFG